MKPIRIGCGAGYSGDRIEPAVELAQKGNLDYLVFECLAERTIAMAQNARLTNHEGGFDPLLEARIKAVLPFCVANKIKIITNMGAANPLEAGKLVLKIARELGYTHLKIAVVTGNDVLPNILSSNLPFIENEGCVEDISDKIISANAYLGVEGILEALKNNADIVITGRVGDPALFMAPLMHEFGWKLNDYDLLGKATLIGHLLECSSQVTGGYFADLSRKNVTGLARLGFPIAEVSENGACFITKVQGSGGAITLQTCKEQLLYEVHDPAAYIQADCVADFSKVYFKEIAPNKISLHGATGKKPTATLKVTIGYRDSFIGEGQISYVGFDAKQRGELAIEIVKERFALTGLKANEMRCDLIGVNALYADNNSEPSDVRVRIIGRTETMSEAIKIGNEVETLWLNGPYGGAGASKSAREVIAAVSVLIPREAVTVKVTFL